MSGIGETLYDGAAEYGKFTSLLAFISGIIIAIILILSGIYLFFLNEDHLVDTTAEVINAECARKENVRVDKYGTKTITYTNTCFSTVKYNVNGTFYEGKITHESTHPIRKGETIEITYDKNKPLDVRAKTIRSRWVAIILSVVAAILVGITGISYYITQRFKIAAAAQGTSSLLSTVTMPFRD